MTDTITLAREWSPKRPEEPPGADDIYAGDIVIVRRPADPLHRYVAYRHPAPRTWPNVLWGRMQWDEVCHLLGIYPCRIECLRRPGSWMADIPPCWGEMRAAELAEFFIARSDGVRTLLGRDGQPVWSTKAEPLPEASDASQKHQPPASQPSSSSPATDATPPETEDFGLPPFEWPSDGQGDLFG